MALHLPCGPEHDRVHLMLDNGGTRMVRCVKCAALWVITPEFQFIPVEPVFTMEELAKESSRSGCKGKGWIWNRGGL
jgi:hypothetical protein